MLAALVFAFFSLGGLWLDIEKARVPNFWNFLFFFAGIFFLKDFSALLIGVASLAWGFFLWKLSVWGAGDAKFFSVLVVWGFVFGFPWWFAVPLFLATAAGLAIATWFKSNTTKYVRWPGTPFMVMAFVVWLLLHTVRSSW